MTFDEASKLIKKGDIVRLRKELQDGLNPNMANQYSWTLLMIAALEGNTSIGSLLLDSGAELDLRNKFHEPALSLAAHTGHSSFVGLLLTSGASVECNPFGNTFEDWLNWAFQYGRCSEEIRGLFEQERKSRAERGPGPRSVGVGNEPFKGPSFDQMERQRSLTHAFFL